MLEPINMETKAIIVIPVLNPDRKLVALVKRLIKVGMRIVIVNDGSDNKYFEIFNIIRDEHGCDICNHSINLGKGAALKTGIRFAAIKYSNTCGVVTADADGQHCPEDILKVAYELEKNQQGILLGSRDFSKKNIPFNSKWGNQITSLVYFLSTGKKCADTQTGLRGIPYALFDISLQVPGDRYEYEMNLLMEMGRRGVPLIPVPITTIYMDNNKSSHFHPVLDSIRIYYNILKYSISSLASAGADIGLFTVLIHFMPSVGFQKILLATAIARLISGSMNFMMNKHFVFRSNAQHKVEAKKYFTLFVCQMIVSWLLVACLSYLPIYLTLIKIFVDTSLFFVSYWIQKKYIFNKKGASVKDEKLLFKTV